MPITELRVEGLRTIEKIRLSLDQLTVLIGENGSGKSSIIEVCEILRRVTGGSFIEEVYAIHGGLTSLLRQGSSRLVMGVTVRSEQIDDREHAGDGGAGKPIDIDYDVALVPSRSFAMIEESLRIRTSTSVETRPPPSATKVRGKRQERRPPEGSYFIRRAGGKIDIVRSGQLISDKIDEQTPFLATLGAHGQASPGSPVGGHLEQPYREAQYVAAYLKNLRVQLPFEVTPGWAERAHGRPSVLRATALFAPADHLEMRGRNLAGAFHALRHNFGEEHWRETLDCIRLGLGDRIEDVTTVADPNGGNIGFAVKQQGFAQEIPAAQLSDGMLTYLAYVALFRLWATQPSLLALDEPDLHLHPHLLKRVVEFFESMASDFPLLVATHSDRLLDCLTDPVRQVVLCTLGHGSSTQLLRLDQAALEKWLSRYRGLGELRAAGHAGAVFTVMDPV